VKSPEGPFRQMISVLTSDHGYQLGERFMWGKVTLFEACNRVPLPIRVPRMTRPGSSSEGLVELVDLFLALAEPCSRTPAADLEGRSLVPMLRDAPAPGKEVAYTVVRRTQELGKAIRIDRWGYARWLDGEEIYNLKEDVEEHVNRAQSGEHADGFSAMRSRSTRTERTAAA